MKNYLGIIPARGGSKGVPKKNIKLICGKPLIYWSIKAARQSKFINRFIVSTEDTEIAKISDSLGAEVHNRPPELASDNSTTLDLLRHIVQEYEYDSIVLLQPTSPIRSPHLIDQCIRIFERGDVESLATGFIAHNYAWGTTHNTPRQLLKGWFYDDGNVYVHDANSLKKGHWVGEKKIELEIDDIYNYEIDTLLDFEIVEFLLNKMNNELVNCKVPNP